MNPSLPKAVLVKSDDLTNCETITDKTVSFEDNCISEWDSFLFEAMN